MTTINLKDFYPWYTQDEYMEVSDELVLRKERLEVLCHAVNSLSEKQGRRVEARILDGKKLKEVAEAEGVIQPP